MQSFYRKTQTGWLLIFIFAPVVLFFLFILYHQEVLGRPFGTNPAPSWILLAFLVFFVMLLSLFATLTLTGFGDHLEIKFGIGLIRKRFFYRNIRSCSVQKNPAIYGWGIRKILGGWLYNVSGSWSVQLDMKDGKMFRIGTPEPEKLEQFLKTRLSLFGSS
jgi:hypothetical protein